MEVPFSIPQCMARCGVVRQAGLSWPGRTSTRPGTVASVATGRLQPRGHQPAVSSPASTVLPCPQLPRSGGGRAPSSRATSGT